MPEASDLIVSCFPMRVREIDDLGSLHEHQEHDDQHHQSLVNKTDKSNYIENDRTDGNIEDDYGFFPMDEDDDIQIGSDGDRERLGSSSSTSNSDASSDQLSSPFGLTTRRRRSRKKSSLKRGSAYGEEIIPLDFERKEFNKVLPKPDLSRRASRHSDCNDIEIIRSGSKGLFRVASEPVFVRPVYQADFDDDDDEEDPLAQSVSSCGPFVEGAMKKRISFGTIQIREHYQTIGDNPSCSYGTPVQLDWEHQDLEELKVEDYETFRPRTRTKEEFHLNQFQRSNLLKMNGHSTCEIKDSKRKVTKFRNQRERTKFMVLNYPQLARVEDAIESGVRKVKRTISNSKLNSMNNNIPRKCSKDDLTVSSTSGGALMMAMMDNDVSNCTAPF
eukprot:CAMPEP_0201121058 /NCGR_PEP_ID=MMETSP0850-20130426/5017_1 /ASSEMBLY_ACC=CAM_ASM_000622 /TAXON_ID=183588 /ORGANISM="Pseudo-nitzschia fraudulenta, Strain WWA7" /LENGTH=387 /DNA_ID=CAMNT_0047387393 /DNA_START=126 /DNA_END=1289 /DNA_ORIENTATION=+